MRTAVRRLVLYALDAGLAALLGFVLLVATARGADLEAFGAFALSLAIVSLQMPLASLGLTALYYSRAATRPPVAARLYWSGLPACLVAGGALYAGTFVLLSAFASPEVTLFYAFAGLRLLGVVGEPLRAIHQARSRPGAYVPIRSATLAAAFAATGVVFGTGAGVFWYAAIWSAEWLAFSAVLLILSLQRRVFLRGGRPRVRPLLAKAAPLLLQSVCVVLYLRFDQLYVGWRFGEATLGIYAAAARVAEIGNLAYGLIGLVAAPRMIREWQRGRFSVTSRSVLALVGLGSVCAFGLCLVWGNGVLSLVFGPAFAAGGLILSVYLLSTCFSVYGTIGSRINVAQGATLPSMTSGLVGASSNVALTIALCEMVGPIGAAIATALSYAVAAAVVWWSAARRARIGVEQVELVRE